MPAGVTRHTIAERRRAYAVQLRSMRRTLQEIADAVLPCPEHQERGGIAPDACRAMHDAARARGNGPLVDCLPMYANREGARRAVEQGLTEQYPVSEHDRERIRQELVAASDLALKRVLRDVLAGADAGDRARSAGAAVRLIDRIAKLTGADAPTRLVVTDELDDELAAALAELSELPLPDPATLKETP